MVQNISLGPAGTPKASTLDGIKYVKEIGLQALEVEFVYGIKMSNALALKIGKIAKDLGIKLSVHAPYYINLNSDDKTKLEASKKRIVTSCERAHSLGATHVVFHPGFYGKDRDRAYDTIAESIKEIKAEIKKNKWRVKLSPETMGKVNVFGSIEEIKRLIKDTGCSCCIDFAHIFARNQGKIDYNDVINKFKRLKHLQCHFSGIEYSDKGERRHLLTDEKELNKLVKAVLKSKINITLINESPNPIKDSLRTKELFEKKGYRFK